ncbi:MAG: hypothetical protein AAGF97_06320 [Planctomycetota bacterium]
MLWGKRAFPETRIIDVVTFPAIYAGMVMCGVYCFANPWADRRFLPRSLWMHWGWAVLNLMAGLIFTVIGKPCAVKPNVRPQYKCGRCEKNPGWRSELHAARPKARWH